MSKPSTELISWVEERETPLPWLSYNSAAGRLEFVIDNHLLQTYRSCPAFFFLMAAEGWHRKSLTTNAPEREWALDFGILFHKMMEVYYREFPKPSFDLADFAIKTAHIYWIEMNMDVHLNHKECQALGGAP